MEKFISSKNQQNPNQNIFQTGENKNIQINKDSHLFLHSKKFLNKTPPNNITNNDLNNNFQTSVDYVEPQPQKYQDLILNIKNNNKITNYQTSNLISSKNNNNNFSNQPNKNKLLEEYFKLKNDNNNYNKNYFTYNNCLYNLSTNKNNNNKKNSESYQPLVKKQKIQKNKKIQKKNIPNPNLNIPPKKSTSSSRIYQPENNMNHSPSFTPIKTTEKNLKSKEKEFSKQSPYFGSKCYSKSNKEKTRKF